MTEVEVTELAKKFELFYCEVRAKPKKILGKTVEIRNKKEEFTKSQFNKHTSCHHRHLTDLWKPTIKIV